MKKFEKFLFFYSILGTTIFFISFGVYSPTPLNFISGVLMLPTAFYFWIRLTSPEHSTPEVWSVRFLFALALLSMLGIFGFYLNSKSMPQVNALNKKVQNLQAEKETLATELESKDTELAKLKTKQATASAAVKGTTSEDLTVADLVAGTPKPGTAQKITGAAGLTEINVYQLASTNSPMVGKIEGDITYPYLAKENGWYKIVLTSQKTGWVSQNQVQEVQ